MKFDVELFEPTKHATLDIARAHLAVRQDQEERGENDFSDIYDSREELQTIKESYLNEQGAFFVGLYNGELAGFIAVKHLRDNPKVGEVKRLAVVKKFRHNALATQLSNAAKIWADSQRFDFLLVRTNARENATNIYERLGFSYAGYVLESKDYEMVQALTSLPLSSLLGLEGIPDEFSFQTLTGDLTFTDSQSPQKTIYNILLPPNSKDH